MIEPVQAVAVGTSVALLGVVLELVRRRRLLEEYSFGWIVISSLLVILAVKREFLHGLSGWLGIHYPPALLLLVLLFFSVVVSLAVSVVLSRQRAQLDRLIEDTAILQSELRELEARLDDARPTPPRTSSGGSEP